MNKHDGGGRILSPLFTEQIRRMNRKFNTCFEWCSGPGYIGRDILKNNLCNNLILADINPESLIYGRDNLGSSRGIVYYESDNLKQIPKELYGKIDLVVANPPNYFNIQSSHPLGKYSCNDLRPNDREWKIHKDFYSNIKPFLTDDAILLVHEIDIFEKKFYLQVDEHD